MTSTTRPAQPSIPLRRSDVILTRLLRPLPARAFSTLLHRRLHGDWRSFREPQTFTERVVAKKLYDQDPRYTLTADKYAVRAHVAERIGEQYLIPLLQVTDDPDAIDLDALPDSFVVKANHGNNATLIVSDKHAIDWVAARATMRGWLDTNWYVFNKEWAYRNIKPQLVVEPFLSDGGKPPADYKIFVFRGRARLVQVDTARFDDHRRDFFDEHWNRLDVTLRYCLADDVPAEPDGFEEMLSLAEQLGSEFTFARVDFYSHKGHVLFGEITHYPEGGTAVWSPLEFDTVLGGIWDTGDPVPERFRVA